MTHNDEPLTDEERDRIQLETQAMYPFSSVTVDAQGAALVMPQGFYIEAGAR